MANATVATTIPLNNVTTETTSAFWTSDGGSRADVNASTIAADVDGNSTSIYATVDYLANATSTVSWLVNATGYTNATSGGLPEDLDYSSVWNETYNSSVGELESVFGDWSTNENTSAFFGLLFNASSTPEVASGTANGSGDVYEGWPQGAMYPSGHTMTQIVITAVLVTMLMIMVVVGNMLVIVAIVTEKALKTIQNWFIASLAVADFLLGLVVMPFSLAQELMGYWIFGFWWCEIHLAVDVLLCTSSIMNLCLISLDRYWSITQAVDYLKKRTPGRAAVMITAVWTLSFLISVPPLLGWKKYEQEANVPFCAVSDDTGYVIYSASGSFYIPSIIMVFVYVRIYFAARSRARRTVKKHRPALDATKDKSTTTTSFSNASPPDKTKGAPLQESANRLHYLSPPVVPQGPAVISSMAVSQHPERTNGETANNNSEALEPLLLREDKRGTPHPVVVSQPSHKGSVRGHGLFFGVGGSIKSNGNSKATTPPGGGCGKASPSPNRLVSQAHALAQAQAQILLSDEMECLSELDHSSDSDQPPQEGKATGLRRLTTLCNPPKKQQLQQQAKAVAVVKADEIDLGRVVKPRDPEREKRRLARKKERRATLILGLIMASFILSWLPFFTLYVFRGLCAQCYINETGFGLAFWLGYCNSALNPVIYTIFNKDFRKAFRKILFK